MRTQCTDQRDLDGTALDVVLGVAAVASRVRRSGRAFGARWFRSRIGTLQSRAVDLVVHEDCVRRRSARVICALRQSSCTRSDVVAAGTGHAYALHGPGRSRSKRRPAPRWRGFYGPEDAALPVLPREVLCGCRRCLRCGCRSERGCALFARPEPGLLDNDANIGSCVVTAGAPRRQQRRGLAWPVGGRRDCVVATGS